MWAIAAGWLSICYLWNPNLPSLPWFVILELEPVSFLFGSWQNGMSERQPPRSDPLLHTLSHSKRVPVSQTHAVLTRNRRFCAHQSMLMVSCTVTSPQSLWTMPRLRQSSQLHHPVVWNSAPERRFPPNQPLPLHCLSVLRILMYSFFLVC